MHKKKVEEVQGWLQRADVSLQLGLPPTPRLLILSGPPGAGKSAMLRVLAHEMHFETCEWVEPRALNREWDEGAGLQRGEADGARVAPRIAAFADFLRDSLRTLSLSMELRSAEAAAASADLPAGATTGVRRRLVVLDELAPAHGTSSAESGQRVQQIVCCVLIKRPILHPRLSKPVHSFRPGPHPAMLVLGPISSCAYCEL